MQNTPTENALLHIFSKEEVSHISIWRDNDVWYVTKKKPFRDEIMASDKQLDLALAKLFIQN